jgi:hypothetical protein
VVQDILPWLSTFANTTAVTVVLVLLFLAFLLNLINRGFFLQMFDILEHKERKRLEQINEYVLSHDAADPETVKVVRDLRDAHYFNVATGIYAENRTRSAFIKLHQTSSHCITWKHIDRARPYMEIAADETITIRDLSRFDKISYWYNQFVAYGSLIFSVVLFLAKFVFSANKGITLFWDSFGLSLFLAVFGFFALLQNSPVRAKDLIAKELQRLRDCSSASEFGHKSHARPTTAGNTENLDQCRE